MDLESEALALVDEISDQVDRRIHPKTGELVPARVRGRHPVRDAQVGETLIDRVDELLEAAVEDWQIESPDVFLDLCQTEAGWAIEWGVGQVDAGAEDDAGAGADGGADSEEGGP